MNSGSPFPTKGLPEDVQRQLMRSEGFLDLKMADRAEQELDQIDPEFRGHAYYRWLTVTLLTQRNQWREALPIIHTLRNERSTEPGFWIQEAYIARRASDIPSARAILESALEEFPAEAIIHFNLACYACQLGHLTEAKQRLKDAVDINEQCIELALSDDDLAPLHDEIEEWQ